MKRLSFEWREQDAGTSRHDIYGVMFIDQIIFTCILIIFTYIHISKYLHIKYLYKYFFCMCVCVCLCVCVCVCREQPLGELDMVKATILKRQYKVVLYGTSTRALTFEDFCQRRQ